MLTSKLLQPKVLLILICAFFLFTRLYKISDIPSSVYWDEASIGYNAYSILQTGKDEWGEVFPLHFRAFGEFKLPVFIYSVVPFIALFGLNEFSVRFPAVLYSLGVVILTYFLAKKISGSNTLGLLGSFFLSVSPWFFIFSRTGYEADAGLFFYLFGVFFFLQLKNRWYILLSAVSFILSAYSYNSFRLVIPLAILILVVYSFKNLVRIGVLPLVLSLVLIALSIIPIFRLYKYDSGAARLQAVGAKSSSLFTNYLSHFSPDFIFGGDTNLRSQQPGFGQLYLPIALLSILGVVYIISRSPKQGILVLALALLGPLPAALTRESPHALRSISVLPFISIISSYGLILILRWIKKPKAVYPMVIIICLIFFANYFLNFLTRYPTQSALDWQYEYKKVYTSYKKEIENSSKVLISDQYAQPYIFTLFYLKYDPQSFRQEVERNSPNEWGFSTVRSFNKFQFGEYQNLVSFE